VGCKKFSDQVINFEVQEPRSGSALQEHIFLPTDAHLVVLALFSLQAAGLAGILSASYTILERALTSLANQGAAEEGSEWALQVAESTRGPINDAMTAIISFLLEACCANGWLFALRDARNTYCSQTEFSTCGAQKPRNGPAYSLLPTHFVASELHK
jgi:hypothetical protein